jgi:hypothetical protein
MSKLCVDAVIDMANEYRLPLMLIASRRQIECQGQGGGYVNGWTTEAFARYVRERDQGDYVLLCRDHGGPWQNYPEVAQRMTLKEAVASAKISLAEDIRCGFDILHIDPSINLHRDLSPDQMREIIKDLHFFCAEGARHFGRDVAFEVGAEEQTAEVHSPAEFEDSLCKLGLIWEKESLPRPIFVVAQTGALVKETRNIGAFSRDEAGTEWAVLEDQLKAITAIASRFGVKVKEHNADYLPTTALRRRPLLGIGALNIAPELGVAETRCLLETCQELGLHKEENHFLQVAFETRKWEKWMLPNSTATDRDKAIIAGHYVFGTLEFIDILGRITGAGTRRRLDVSAKVMNSLKGTLRRYLASLGLIHAEGDPDETY